MRKLTKNKILKDRRQLSLRHGTGGHEERTDPFIIAQRWRDVNEESGTPFAGGRAVVAGLRARSNPNRSRKRPARASAA